MIPGIGVDLLHLPRLSTLLSRRNGHYLNRFARRILTRNELATFQRKLGEADGATREWGREGGLVRWLGVRWAAKEAAFKATGGVRGALGWKEVQVEYHPSGQPYLSVSRGSEKAVGGLSISHDGEYVIAMAMLPATPAQR
ncbi:uncharacterized protein LAJ45_09824 [Morchella importuna]|uniref:4'-phosphopantetheinyl transferase n=1 Tax=Morchella conica CCBAS932 TaxID=1392247 RepID=A0A3N4KLB7_9PEZI|nr:uncharacterized protein LAJ45_09824 [Morchella importuna]KAH8146134.1 hypothetical protein LAJ45_09824 [Morchella importuna]RPB11357.1 4'-phosphopantetheinyl transferase [Morchella conica CCBAS932]